MTSTSGDELLGLVRRCGEGDADGWRALLPALQAIGRRTLRPLRLSGFDADDVLGDALTSLHAGGLSRFRGSTVSELIEFLRMVVHDRALEIAKARMPAEVGRDGAHDDNVALVCRELVVLKRDDRELYLMSAHGLGEREMAGQTGRPAAAVTTQLAIVLERLRARLGPRRELLPLATEHLVEDLDRRAQSPADGCISTLDLERRLTGRVDAATQARIDAHLEPCLTCLNAFVELRDDLQGLADPEPASPVLSRVLEGRLDEAARRPRLPETRGGLRQLVTARFPAWAVAAVAAGVLLVLGVALHREREAPVRLTPVSMGAERTVAGVVDSVSDARNNGVEAHVVSLTDGAGVQYLLFVWGSPKVGAGDRVEIDAIVASSLDANRRHVYQGVATALRRAR